jgi:hypothetical protein
VFGAVAVFGTGLSKWSWLISAGGLADDERVACADVHALIASRSARLHAREQLAQNASPRPPQRSAVHQARIGRLLIELPRQSKNTVYFNILSISHDKP